MDQDFKNNRIEATKFEEKLITSFESCMSTQNNESQKVTRDRIWIAYHLNCWAPQMITLETFFAEDWHGLTVCNILSICWGSYFQANDCLKISLDKSGNLCRKMEH